MAVKCDLVRNESLYGVGRFGLIVTSKVFLMLNTSS